ncbi:MAG: hypothetical protein ACXU7D_09640 [Burkholderiaceae bacterium]
MFILLLVAGSVIGIMLYRSITSLLAQIPKGNRDFNVFLPESSADSATSAITGVPHHKASQSILEMAKRHT